MAKTKRPFTHVGTVAYECAPGVQMAGGSARHAQLRETAKCWYDDVGSCYRKANPVARIDGDARARLLLDTICPMTPDEQRKCLHELITRARIWRQYAESAYRAAQTRAARAQAALVVEKEKLAAAEMRLREAQQNLAAFVEQDGSSATKDC